MRYVSLKKNKKNSTALSVLALVALTSSCSLRSNGQQQTLTIALPGAHFVQNPILKGMTEWISLAWASTTTATNLNNDPASLSEFDCFAVNVNGPGINLDPGVTCTDPADAPAIFGGFVPNGNSSIDLVVPAGPDRSIRIMGVKSLIGCPNLHDMLQDGAINFKNIGHFYEVGSTRQDIFSDATVTIKASYSATSPKRAFDQCKRTGEIDGSHLWAVYAGTGPGNVNATKTISGTSYITGKFDYIGPNTHSGVMLTQNLGSLAGSNIAHLNGTVNCAVPDGAGGYFVGGSFNHVESTNFSNAGVIHVAADGSWDSSFVINLDAGKQVKTCLRDGIHLYLGGDFSSLTWNAGASVTTTALADFNLLTKTPTNLGLIATFDASPMVNSISLGSSRLYAGGNFTYSGGTHSRAVAIDLSAGAPAIDGSWHPDPDGTVNAVYALNASSSVLLGGAFYNAGGAARARLANVDASTGTALAWNPTSQLAGVVNVNSIVSDGSYAYAALVASSNQAIARFDFSASPSRTDIFSSNTVGDSFNTLALSTTTTSPILYVGGKFKTTAPVAQNFAALLNPGTSAPPLSTAFSANTNAGSSVLAIAPDAIGRIYVGGDFQSIGGAPRGNLAAVDLSSGTATTWGPTGAMGEGTSLASDGTSLYVGYKSDSTHSILGGVKKLTTGASATLLGQANTNTYSGEDVSTISLSSDNSSLYVGGTFNSMAGHGSLTGLAKLFTSTMSYDSGWMPVLAASGSPSVNTILPTPDRVYVGGSFNSLNGGTHEGLVALNTASGTALSGWSNAGLTQGVQAVTYLPSGELAVGTQTTGGTPTAAIRKIDANNGSSLIWPNGQTDILPTGMIKAYSLLTLGGYLYIGGLADGSSGSSLMAFDLTQGQFNSGFTPWPYNMYNPSDNYVSAIEGAASGVLLIGGKYSQANVTDSLGSGGKEAWGLGLFNANTGEYY
jgi:hypothetical protein